MMNKYYNILNEAKEKIRGYLDTIYQVSGYELLLELEHYNLLSNENNCLETSSAIGFIIEEFETSKLEIFTHKFEVDNNDNEVVIKKLSEVSTVKSSYDCFAKYKGILFLINIKVEKIGSVNNGIAGINILYKDYVEKDDNEKVYLILKTHYYFGNSNYDNERKIMIKAIDCYALEEIDFSKGHMQDKRNWKAEFNENSGRLLISKGWLNKNRLDCDEISYKKTRKFIKDIYFGNN